VFSLSLHGFQPGTRVAVYNVIGVVMKSGRFFNISAQVLATMAAVAAGQPALASKLSPSWVKSISGSEATNASYLANQGIQTPSSEVALIHSIFADDSLEQELRQQYMTMVISSETRSHHDLRSMENDQLRIDNQRSFTNKVFNDTRNFHMNVHRGKLRSKASKVEGLNGVRRPVEIAAGLAAVYQGHPVDVKTPGNANLRFQMDPKLDTVGDEQYKLSVSRGLPLWDLTSGVGFGSTSQTVTASLGKRLSDNLRAEVDSSKSLRTGGPASALKFFYDIRF
jgi:hypothetical protein